MKKVLWLASWYPNEADPFTGDFIQRHARATAPFQPLEVVFIGKRPSQIKAAINPAESVSGLTEKIIYFNGQGQPGKTKPRLASTPWPAALSFFRCFQRWFNGYRKINGLPDVVHVHVAMRAGLIALYLKKRFAIPYLLTEHWTAYFANSAFPIAARSRIYRFLIRQILKNAALVLPVSADLGKHLSQTFGPLPLQVIPNVVDTRIFFLKTSSPACFRFIHISSMTRGKNPNGILRAFATLIDGGIMAELVMIGPAETPHLANPRHRQHIRFTGELSYPAVAAELRQANAFVLFSERENQPCVILESLCCGVPVIATRTGGIPEIVNDSNGILIDSGDEPALINAMRKMYDEYSRYEPARISARASEQFSYATIGEAYAQCYSRIMQTKPGE